MRIFIDDIEVDNYAFIKEIYDDRIILDNELSYNSFPLRGSHLHLFPRVYNNLSTIDITKLEGNVAYLGDNRQPSIYLTHGALVCPGHMPQLAIKVLYSLFGKNQLRVAKRKYADWQESVTFPKERDFELAWRIENRLGTHNPNYIHDSEISVNTCDFCSEKFYKDTFASKCNLYCGEGKSRLRRQILASC